MFQVRDVNTTKIKYAGRSRATVIDNRDPQKRGRIRVGHSLLGETVWIPYLRANATFDVPSIGDVVYIEADAGFYTHPIAWGNLTKGSDEPNIPTAFQRDVPTNRGMFTPGGHLVELDDGIAPIVSQEPNDKNYTTENRGIRITSTANNKIHIIEDADAGNQYILLQDAGGNIIKLDYKNNELTINSIGKTNINTTTDKTETVGGNNSLEVTGNNKIKITGTQTLEVTGAAEEKYVDAYKKEIGADAEETITGNLTITVTGNVSIEASGNASIKAGGTAEIGGALVTLGGGGPGIARIGDLVIGTGNLGIPVVSTIVAGSTVVTSA